MSDERQQTEEWLAQFTHPDLSDAAEAAIENLGGNLSERAKELLRPLLRWRIHQFRRNSSRHRERSHPLRELYTGDTPDLTVIDEAIAQHRKRILADEIIVCDEDGSRTGQRVTKGDATAEHWEFYKRHLIKLRGGIDKTIEECNEALRQLRVHNAECLNEIGGKAA